MPVVISAVFHGQCRRRGRFRCVSWVFHPRVLAGTGWSPAAAEADVWGSDWFLEVPRLWVFCGAASVEQCQHGARCHCGPQPR